MMTGEIGDCPRFPPVSLLKLMEDAKLRQKMGEAGRKRAVEKSQKQNEARMKMKWIIENLPAIRAGW